MTLNTSNSTEKWVRVLGTPVSHIKPTEKTVVTDHQSLNGRAPPYLSQHCIPVSSADTRRHLRSANGHLLDVPRFRLNTYGRRAFSVAGLMAWNSLPNFVRDPASSTDCFRRLLKKYSFTHAAHQRFLTIGLMRYSAIGIHAPTHSR